MKHTAIIENCTGDTVKLRDHHACGKGIVLVWYQRGPAADSDDFRFGLTADQADSMADELRRAANRARESEPQAPDKAPGNLLERLRAAAANVRKAGPTGFDSVDDLLAAAELVAGPLEYPHPNKPGNYYRASGQIVAVWKRSGVAWCLVDGKQVDPSTIEWMTEPSGKFVQAPDHADLQVMHEAAVSVQKVRAELARQSDYLDPRTMRLLHAALKP